VVSAPTNSDSGPARRRSRNVIALTAALAAVVLLVGLGTAEAATIKRKRADIPYLLNGAPVGDAGYVSVQHNGTNVNGVVEYLGNLGPQTISVELYQCDGKGDRCARVTQAALIPASGHVFKGTPLYRGALGHVYYAKATIAHASTQRTPYLAFP
jgi:hypothetical protein